MNGSNHPSQSKHTRDGRCHYNLPSVSGCLSSTGSVFAEKPPRLPWWSGLLARRATKANWGRVKHIWLIPIHGKTSCWTSHAVSNKSDNDKKPSHVLSISIWLALGIFLLLFTASPVLLLLLFCSILHLLGSSPAPLLVLLSSSPNLLLLRSCLSFAPLLLTFPSTLDNIYCLWQGLS